MLLVEAARPLVARRFRARGPGALNAGMQWRAKAMRRVVELLAFLLLALALAIPLADRFGVSRPSWTLAGISIALPTTFAVTAH